jgi:hypothetical protein
MDFDELDRRMRVVETAHDHCVLPGLFIKKESLFQYVRMMCTRLRCKPGSSFVSVMLDRSPRACQVS